MCDSGYVGMQHLVWALRLCGHAALWALRHLVWAMRGMRLCGHAAPGTLASALAHSWSGGGAAAMDVHSSVVQWDGTRAHFCCFWQAEPLGSLA